MFDSLWAHDALCRAHNAGSFSKLEADYNSQIWLKTSETHCIHRPLHWFHYANWKVFTLPSLDGSLEIDRATIQFSFAGFRSRRSSNFSTQRLSLFSGFCSAKNSIELKMLQFCRRKFPERTLRRNVLVSTILDCHTSGCVGRVCGCFIGIQRCINCNRNKR